MKTNHSKFSSLLFNMYDTRKGHPAKLPDALFGSCFIILNSSLNPTPEDYRATFLIYADVIYQTVPQFFPEFCLLSRQIFQLVDEVRENFPRVILLLYECLQFLKSAVLFTVHQAHYRDKNTPPKRGANILNCVYLCMSTLVPVLNATAK